MIEKFLLRCEGCQDDGCQDEGCQDEGCQDEAMTNMLRNEVSLYRRRRAVRGWKGAEFAWFSSIFEEQEMRLHTPPPPGGAAPGELGLGSLMLTQERGLKKEKICNRKCKNKKSKGGQGFGEPHAHPKKGG